jgi:hypothetical protein
MAEGDRLDLNIYRRTGCNVPLDSGFQRASDDFLHRFSAGKMRVFQPEFGYRI